MKYEIRIITLNYLNAVDTYINFTGSTFYIWIKLWEYSLLNSKIDYFIDNLKYKKRKGTEYINNLYNFIFSYPHNFNINYFNSITLIPLEFLPEATTKFIELKKQIIFSTDNYLEFTEKINNIINKLEKRKNIEKDEYWLNWKEDYLDKFLVEIKK